MMSDERFYTNITSGAHIPSATCMIEFDDNPGTSFGMTDSGTQYTYNKTSGFSTQGSHSWNVTCSATGFVTLNATDDIDIISGVFVPEFSTVTLAIGLIAVLAGILLIRRK